MTERPKLAKAWACSRFPAGMIAAMHPIRTIARPLLAAPFVAAGVEALRDPGPRADRIAPLVKPLADRVSWIPADPEALVRMQGALGVGAGTLLALGRLQRLTAVALAAGLMPTLLTEDRFWNEDDPARRAEERRRFLMTAGLFGALLTAATAPSRRRGAPGRTRARRTRAGRTAQKIGRRRRRTLAGARR
jgi:putative oxidoreductase